MPTQIGEVESYDDPVRWNELTGPAIGRMLANDPRHVCLLPIGATEQHGPHLPTGTDTIIATLLCDEVSRRTRALVLPPISLGASFFHGTTFSGTLSASPEELAGQVRRTAEWATYSGVQRLLLLNGHVGNRAALTIAVDYLRLDHPDVRIGVANWWEINESVASRVTADGEDWHANRAETSLLLALAPEMVDMSAAEGADDPDRTSGLVFRYAARHLSRNGVTGYPSSATRELGFRILEDVVGTLVDVVHRAKSEEPPLP
jgi:creatinine amidohydrolase